MAAVKLANPGLSEGFAPLPVRSTKAADTIGRPGRSLTRTVRPFGSWNEVGDGNCSARASPGFGISFRQGSSAFTDSAPVPGAAFATLGVATGAPRSGAPGTPCTTTRALEASCWPTKALTVAGVTSRYRWMSFGR